MSRSATPAARIAATTFVIAVAASSRASAAVGRVMLTPRRRSATSGTSVTRPMPVTVIVRSGVVVSTANALLVENNGVPAPATNSPIAAPTASQRRPARGSFTEEEVGIVNHLGARCGHVRATSSGRRTTRHESSGSALGGDAAGLGRRRSGPRDRSQVEREHDHQVPELRNEAKDFGLRRVAEDRREELADARLVGQHVADVERNLAAEWQRADLGE